MRRESSAEIAAIAGRRLEQLGRVRDSGVLADAPKVTPARVREPGRHARHRPPPASERAGAWVGRRLPALAGTIRLRAAHLTALLAVAVIVLAATAWWAVHGATPEVVPASAPIARTSESSASPADPGRSIGNADPASASLASPGAPPTSGSVVVDVAGKVRRPGIVTLPAGSRVTDALRRAGGARAGVDLTSINLARVLTDGEQILVGAPASVSGASSGTSSGTASVSATGGGETAAGGPPVNLNTAGAQALEELPGVGPVTAQKIVDWRTEHGAFRAVDELLEVDGIGPKTLAELAPRATL